jgi:VWFA-related protein
MKRAAWVHAVVLSGLLGTPLSGFGQTSPAQSFSAGVSPAGIEVSIAAGDAPDSAAYAAGTRAINEGRWADAAAIFAKVAAGKGAHADGALYWKAYAENKLGQAQAALATCAALRGGFPQSGWIGECGALEIEIGARSGKPVEPRAGDDDDLKLLALNTLMRQDEARAVAQIQRILKSDSSARLKQEAVLILSKGKSMEAQDLLGKIALGKIGSAKHDTALQAKASGLLREQMGMQTDAAHAGGEESRKITLDVVVTDKSGQPVSGLQAADFTVLDNKRPVSLASFKAAGAGGQSDAPVEAILVVDALNTGLPTVAKARQSLESLFKENHGRLPLPTSLVLLSQEGFTLSDHPTQDGKTLTDFLDKNPTLLREHRGSAIEVNEERWDLSMRALPAIAAEEGKRPGRKLLIWISEGWSSFSALSGMLTNRQQQGIFSTIVQVSTALRQAHVTLYSVDPTGAGQFQRHGAELFQPVTTEKRVDPGNLLLQVIAVQSGGLELYGSNDVGEMAAQCMADAASYYEITLDASVAAHADEYHSIDVQVNKPGLKARTRMGYYAQR